MTDDPRRFFKEYSPGTARLGSLKNAAIEISLKHGAIGLSLTAQSPEQKGDGEIQFQCHITAEQAKRLGESLLDAGRELEQPVH